MGTVVVPVNRPTAPPEADTIMPIFHFCTSGSPSLGPRSAAGFSALPLLGPRGQSGCQRQR